MTTSAPLGIAIIGGGNMARGLLGGLLKRVDPERIVITAASVATRAALARDFKVRVSEDNIAAVASAGVVVLAVKPQILREVTRQLAAELRIARPLVISVAAGITAGQLQDWIGGGVPVVRAMPNRPALIGAGATGLYAADNVDEAARALATELLASTGLVLWVQNEQDIDLVTALSGCGPAYFFRLAELMADAAIADGLDPAAARQLARQTLAGAGQMVAAAGEADLAAMRAAVASRGGSTAAALARFDELGLPATVQAAMRAATNRSRELSQQLGSNKD